MKRYLAWYPSVHAQFLDELVFYFISVRAFPNDGVYEELTRILVDTGHTTFRAYRVFGSYDIILRVWVRKGHADELATTLSKSASYIEDVEPAVVGDIPHHWKYRHRPPTASLPQLVPSEIRRIQSFFDKPDKWAEEPVRSALANSLVRIVEETDDNVLFFVCITHADTRRLDPHTLIQEIFSLFGKFPELEKTAVYQTKTKFGFLIKGETKEVFKIGGFVIELNNKFAMQLCKTLTYVVMDPRIRGREEIGKRAFSQVEKRDISTMNILPELYEGEDMPQKERARIESWINEELIPYRDELTEDEFQGLRTCLLAVVARKETRFLSAIVELFGPAERELRRLQGPFLGKVMGSNPSRVIQAALQHTPNAGSKKLATLSLGDRIDVYLHVIRDKRIRAEPIVLEGWSELVQLRDAAAHYNESVFPKWWEKLPFLVQFLRRYKGLVAVVKPIAEGSADEDHGSDST